jgi:hypothetical protein
MPTSSAVISLFLFSRRVGKTGCSHLINWSIDMWVLRTPYLFGRKLQTARNRGFGLDLLLGKIVMQKLRIFSERGPSQNQDGGPGGCLWNLSEDHWHPILFIFGTLDAQRRSRRLGFTAIRIYIVATRPRYGFSAIRIRATRVLYCVSVCCLLARSRRFRAIMGPSSQTCGQLQ